MEKNILISFGNLKVKAQLNDSHTAKMIYDALPIESEVQRWGDEIYFSVGKYKNCLTAENSFTFKGAGAVKTCPTQQRKS